MAAEIVVYSGEVPRIALTNLSEPGRTQFHGGDRWAYRALRTGGTQGLDAAAPYRWRVDLHHNQHSHPLIVDQAVISDTIDLAESLHGGAWNLWFRFYLTTRTETGLEFTVEEEIFPALAAITAGSQPPGAEIKIDGVPYQTEQRTEAIVGTQRTLVASRADSV